MKLLAKALLTSSALLVASATYAAEEGGIPQMDQTWYANQLFWLAISFGLLFIVTSRYISPTIAGILSKRENAIAEAIREAEKAKREADSTSSDVAAASQNSRVRAAEIMAQSQAEISRDAAKAMAKLEHDIERKADHANAVLSDALKRANTEIDAAVDELAKVMVDKLLGQPTVDSDTGPKLKLAVKR